MIPRMTMGLGLFLVAVGAILRYAVEDTWDAVDIPTIGLILMIVGIVGFLVGAAYAFGLGSRGGPHDRPPPPPSDPRY